MLSNPCASPAIPEEIVKSHRKQDGVIIRIASYAIQVHYSCASRFNFVRLHGAIQAVEIFSIEYTVGMRACIIVVLTNVEILIPTRLVIMLCLNIHQTDFHLFNVLRRMIKYSLINLFTFLSDNNFLTLHFISCRVRFLSINDVPS